MPAVGGEYVAHITYEAVDDGHVADGEHPQALVQVTQSNVEHVAVLVGDVVVHQCVGHGRGFMVAVEWHEPRRGLGQPLVDDGLGSPAELRARAGLDNIALLVLHDVIRVRETVLEPVVEPDLKAVPEDLAVVVDRAPEQGARGVGVRGVDRR